MSNKLLYLQKSLPQLLFQELCMAIKKPEKNFQNKITLNQFLVMVKRLKLHLLKL